MLWCQQFYHNTKQFHDWNLDERTAPKFVSAANRLWQELLCHVVLPHFWCLRVASVSDKCRKTLRAVQQALGSFLKSERHDSFGVAFNSNQLYLLSALRRTGFYPFVHFFCTVGVFPTCPGVKAGLQPRQIITGLHRDKQPFTVKLTPTANSELPISLMCLTVLSHCAAVLTVKSAF